MNESLVIGITGGSGSGKTYLVSKVAELFAEGEVAVITQDNYYRPKEEQYVDPNGVTNFDLPSALHLDQFRRDIKALLQGEVVQRTEYVFNNSEAIPGVVKIVPARVILVEGLFLLHDDDLTAMLDLSVFVDVKPAIKLERRIARDSVERNYPIDDVQYRFTHHVTPAYEKYIAPNRYKADLVINNNRSIDRAASVLAAYVRQHLLR